MLFAQKESLGNNTKVRLIGIRERELGLYVQNLRALGTIGSIIAGLGFFGLLYTDQAYFRTAGELQKGLYVATNILTMCVALEVCFGTTAVVMLGPGYALRGPDGSMNIAVDGILVEHELVATLLRVSIHLFLLTTVAYAYLEASPHLYCSLLITALVGLIDLAMVRRITAVEASFPLRSLPLVSGAFFYDTVAAARGAPPHEPASARVSRHGLARARRTASFQEGRPAPRRVSDMDAGRRPRAASLASLREGGSAPSRDMSRDDAWRSWEERRRTGGGAGAAATRAGHSQVEHSRPPWSVCDLDDGRYAELRDEESWSESSGSLSSGE